MSARQLFEMTQADYDELIHAMRPIPLVALQCGMPPSQQEMANDAWKRLGERMGFDGMSVEPSSRGKVFFTALPIPSGEAMSGYDYIKRAYGLEFSAGQRVRHIEIDKLGTVARCKESSGHYVQVRFDGKKHADPCHPQALEFVEVKP